MTTKMEQSAHISKPFESQSLIVKIIVKETGRRLCSL